MTENGVEVLDRVGFEEGEKEIGVVKGQDLQSESVNSENNDSKDSEGDEVFEEAMDVPVPSPEDCNFLKPDDSHDVVVNGDGNVLRSQGVEGDQEIARADEEEDQEIARADEIPNFEATVVDLPNHDPHGEEEEVFVASGSVDLEENIGEDKREESFEVAAGPLVEANVQHGLIDESNDATESDQESGNSGLDGEGAPEIELDKGQSNGGLSDQLLDRHGEGDGGSYMENVAEVLVDGEGKNSEDNDGEQIEKRDDGIGQEKVENGDVDKVDDTGEIAVFQESEPNDLIPKENVSGEMQDFSSIVASPEKGSYSEEDEVSRGEDPSSLNDIAVMSQKAEEADTDNSAEKDFHDLLAELQHQVKEEINSGETNHSEIYDNKSTMNKFVERESASSVELDEYSSSDNDDKLDTEPVMAAMRSIIESAKSVAEPAKSSTSSVASSSAGNLTDLPPPARPAGLGSSAPLLEPIPRTQQQSRVNGAAPVRQAQVVEDPVNGETDENSETREKLQMIRVKFLRLAHRLGQTPHNVVVAQVLYRLGLAEQLRGSRNTSRAGAFSFDRASAMAEQLEAAGQEPLDFSCTIMVLGKSGVGKSATINSIFDEVKFSTDAFQIGTKKVQDITGTVQGIKLRVIDTPGLLPSSADLRRNEKILHSVKKFIKKTPPDIVLYLDRLDMQSRDHGDLPLLRSITDIFGPAVWFNAIVVLTHAASAPPDGPNGTPLSYEMFVTQRSHVVQQAIRQAAGDMRLMNPVSLVENHSACRTNRAGQRVLPNGQVWKPQLLLLSFASKILAEANTLLKLQDSPPGKPFGVRSRVPPLPFLLSSLLQSRPQLRLPEEQFGDDDTLDDDLDESSDSDDESEYDELPPFKRLTKAQLAKLSKTQKKAYFDELEYREKLFMKKQLKEEKRRRKLMKKMAATSKDWQNEYNENMEEESSGAASVPVPMPDMALPASFDSDNPTHRYRFLDSSNQWLVRPVLEPQGWDHDVGYEGLNVERLFVVKDKIPVSVSGQVTKDKKESNLQMEVASSIKHGEGKSTSLGFDMQTVGKDIAYTLRSETRFSNFRNNKTAAGLSVTLLGDAITAGLKVEDRIMIRKRLKVVMTGGAMTGRGDVAYGGSLEATLRDKDYPIGRSLSTLGLSVMDWHGDLAIGCNVQSQFPVGRHTNLIARANLNNRGAGQVSIRFNSSEQLQIALIGLFPILKNIIKNRLFASQHMQ